MVMAREVVRESGSFHERLLHSSKTRYELGTNVSAFKQVILWVLFTIFKKNECIYFLPYHYLF